MLFLIFRNNRSNNDMKRFSVIHSNRKRQANEKTTTTVQQTNMPEVIGEEQPKLVEALPQEESNQKSNQALTKPKLKSSYEKKPMPTIRYDGREHWPNFDKDDGRKGFRCKNCGKQTTVYCEKCNVHICFFPGKRGRNCFKQYHSKK